MNYFNYFTEIEDEFVRRRGSHLMISPIDWALVEAWKNAGIPLHVVLRGINKAFDSYESGSPKFRKVNSVLYCEQAVEESFSEWTLTQVGSSTAGAQPDSKPDAGRSSVEFIPSEILGFLERVDHDLQAFTANCGSALERARAELGLSESTSGKLDLLAEAIQRTRERLAGLASELRQTDKVNAEVLERDLDAIDRLLLEEIKSACGEELLSRYRKEAKAELKAYRKKMEKEIYDQTAENFVSRRLRDTFGIPRLSLLFL